MPKLPLRGVILAPSGSGKTVLLSNLILKMYRGCFERVYVFSPSVNVDQTWEAVKKYQEDVMKVKESDTEKLYFDHYDPEDLENIISTQHKVILHMKKQKHSHLFSILVIVDDFADDPSFSRHSKMLQPVHKRWAQQYFDHRLNSSVHGGGSHYPGECHLSSCLPSSKREGLRNAAGGAFGDAAS